MIKENTFAEACYNMNTIQELEKILKIGPDKTDMRDWSLSESEWTEQIKLAIDELKSKI